MTKRSPASAAPLLLPDEARWIAIWACRYALGRRSAAVSSAVSWIRRVWPMLEDATRGTIRRDLEEAFERDDEARRRPGGDVGALARPLGDDCDRAQWAAVRALYRTPTCCECKRPLGADQPQTIHTDGERTCEACNPFGCVVCGLPFDLGEVIHPVAGSRWSRHPGCPEPVGGAGRAA